MAYDVRIPEEIQAREMMLRLLADAIPAVIWSTDRRLRFTSSFGAGLAALNLRPDQVLGKTLFEYFRTEDPDFPPIAAHRRALRGESVSFEIQWAGRTYQSRVAPLPDGEDGVAGCTGIAHDITERKRAGEERERFVATLEAKNAELERFAYTVSHDFKTPLVTIRGFLGMLEQDAARGKFERMKEDVARIRNAAERMQQLLDGLLELSRIGRLTDPRQEVSLGELAHEAVDLAAGAIAARGAHVEISPHLPVLFGERLRILEVLQNLIDNAVKFIGDRPEPRVEIGVRRDSGETVCYVRDNGIGIDPRYHQKVFGLFDQLDPESEGTGVGLALVKRIVEVHGGRIWIESEGQGQGCTFCFTMPRNQGSTNHDK